jgi:methionyl-tRNA formyltransferase
MGSRIITFVNLYTGALVLQDLVNAGHEVVGVVLFPPDMESKVPAPEFSVRETGWKNLLPTYTVHPDRMNKEFVDVVRRLQPDLLVTMHFPKIFGRRMLETPRLGCVNMHPSKVPAGRGYAPMQWHMAIGEPQLHMTLHYLDVHIDTGPIIDVASVEVEPGDTGWTAGLKLCRASAEMFKRNLPAILEGTAPRRPQSEEGASLCWKGDPWDRIEWDKPSLVVDRRIRAYARPMGGAYTFVGGQRMTVWSARYATEGERDLALSGGSAAGEVVAVLGDGWLVRTGDGAMVITDAELTAPEGAARQSAGGSGGVRGAGVAAGKVVLG